MTIGKIASSVEYLMDELFKNCQFSESNFGFPNWKNSRNLLTFQIWTIITKISNLENLKKFQFVKFAKLAT